MKSTSIDTPSVSDIRMNSWRLSSHMCPVLVRNWMPWNHSSWVGRTSRTKACRCLTRLCMIWRVRLSGAFETRFRTSAVRVFSLNSRLAMTGSSSREC